MMLYHSEAATGENDMRTTIALDDDLVAQAQNLTSVKEKSVLMREALKALIARESGRRLALLGGSEPKAAAAPRRRSVSKASAKRA